MGGNRGVCTEGPLVLLSIPTNQKDGIGDSLIWSATLVWTGGSGLGQQCSARLHHYSSRNSLFSSLSSFPFSILALRLSLSVYLFFISKILLSSCRLFFLALSFNFNFSDRTTSLAWTELHYNQNPDVPLFFQKWSPHYAAHLEYSYRGKQQCRLKDSRAISIVLLLLSKRRRVQYRTDWTACALFRLWIEVECRSLGPWKQPGLQIWRFTGYSRKTWQNLANNSKNKRGFS